MWGELSSEWGELSSQCGASCLGASFLWGELSWGELSLGRVVRNPAETTRIQFSQRPSTIIIRVVRFQRILINFQEFNFQRMTVCWCL